MSLSKTVLSPTAIDHSVEAVFTHPKKLNLILAKANVLQIYEISQVPASSVMNDGANDDLCAYTTRLIHMMDCRLNGRIIAIAPVRTQSPNGLLGLDSLILTFSDAKMALLEFSMEQNSVQTISIHYYEREEFKKISSIDKYPPMLRVDHLSRCAVLSFYSDRLAILPFKQGANMDAMDYSQKNNRDFSSKSNSYLPSVVISLSAIDVKLKNIQDFCFLYDYFEPTMAILYETHETWTGSLASRQDTKGLMVVSMDFNSKNFPVIYQIDDLPYNAYKIQPVPGPTGGLLIITPNGLIHVDQTSIPGIAASVNRFFGKEMELKVDSEGDVAKPAYYIGANVCDFSALTLNLADCQVTFLNPDSALFILSNGSLVLVELLGFEKTRGYSRLKNGVKAFNITLLANLKLSSPSCICRIGGGFTPTSANQNRPRILGSLANQATPEKSAYIQMGYFFVGSKIDVAFLVQFVENKEIMDLQILNGHQDNSEIKNDDDLADIYGFSYSSNENMTHNVSKASAGQFQYRICDGVAVLGAIKDMSVGKPHAYSTIPFQPLSEHVTLEIATCNGDDVNPHLTILQRQFRPRIISSFPMTDVQEIWTVQLNTLKANHETQTSRRFDDFLFISKSNETVVFKTGKELLELEKQYFTRAERTVCVAAVLDSSCLLQITTKSAFLFDGEFNLLSTLGLEHINREPILNAVIKKNVALLHFDKGAARMVKLSRHGFEIVNVEIPNVKCCDLYIKEHENSTASFFVVLVTTSGTLMIFDESMSAPICTYGNFSDLPALLQPELVEKLDESELIVSFQDVIMVDIPLFHGKFETFLVVKQDDQMTVYKEFSAYPSNKPSFFKLNFDGIEIDDENPVPNQEFPMEDTDPIPMENLFRKQLHTFKNLGTHGYSGIFDTGKRPRVLIFRKENDVLPNLYTEQNPEKNCLPPISSHSVNRFQIHPFELDSQITCFTEFNNVNCQRGFIYFSQKGNMRIANLIDHFHYDREWPTAKIELNLAPEAIAYHSQSETYAIAGSFVVPFELAKAKYSASMVGNVPSDQREHEMKPGDTIVEAGCYLPNAHQFKLLLVSPITWEVVDTIELEEYEHVLCMSIVDLNTKQTQSGKKSMLAVGTGYMRGEDLPCRGRILLYDIIEVVPEIDNPQTNHKYKLMCKTDEKGQVSAISSVSGLLLCGIGSKIIAFSFDDDETLAGIAFIDVNYFITSLCAVRNVLVVGDVLKSISFIAFQEDPPKLVLLGKDYHQLNVLSTEFLINGSDLGIFIADGDKNVHLFQYQPYNAHSLSGQRLLRKGDFHTDCLINKFIRLRCLVKDQGPSSDKSYMTIGATMEGSIVMTTPISEKLYKRLYALYSRMIYQEQHIAGLNPRGYRQLKLSKKIVSSAFASSGTALGPPGPRMILDGDLIFPFLRLNRSSQKELCKSIGSSSLEIYTDLSIALPGLNYF